MDCVKTSISFHMTLYLRLAHICVLNVDFFVNVITWPWKQRTHYGLENLSLSFIETLHKQ